MLKKPVSGVLGRGAVLTYRKYAPAASLPRALLTGFLSILLLSVIRSSLRKFHLTKG